MFDQKRLEEVARRVGRLRLPLVNLNPGTVFWRIIPSDKEHEIATGLSHYRFTDPRYETIPEDECFKVLFMSRSFETAFLETVVRDVTDNRNGLVYLDESEVLTKDAVEFEITRKIPVVDLFSNEGAQRLGAPTDLIFAMDFMESRYLSYAACGSTVTPAGILYPSRLTRRANCALYDHSWSALKVVSRRPLTDYDLKPILDAREIAIL